MKVRRLVLAVIHGDENAQKLADDRHDTILSNARRKGKTAIHATLCLRWSAFILTRKSDVLNGTQITLIGRRMALLT